MDQIAADMFPPSHIPYQVIFARMLASLMLGAIIGFEREAKSRPAGLKTHMLVALAACTFSIISLESVYMKGFFDQRVQIDPLRVVEAVTAGVAFLAAGTIVLSRGRVQGLTTGSSLWLAGAIGLALGFGHWIIAIFAAGSAFFVLTVVGWLSTASKEEAKTLDGGPRAAALQEEAARSGKGSR